MIHGYEVSELRDIWDRLQQQYAPPDDRYVTDLFNEIYQKGVSDTHALLKRVHNITTYGQGYEHEE